MYSDKPTLLIFEEVITNSSRNFSIPFKTATTPTLNKSCMDPTINWRFFIIKYLGTVKLGHDNSNRKYLRRHASLENIIIYLQACLWTWKLLMTMKITYVGNKNILILIQVCHATFPASTVDFSSEVLGNFPGANFNADVALKNIWYTDMIDIRSI